MCNIEINKHDFIDLLANSGIVVADDCHLVLVASGKKLDLDTTELALEIAYPAPVVLRLDPVPS